MSHLKCDNESELDPIKFTGSSSDSLSHFRCKSSGIQSGDRKLYNSGHCQILCGGLVVMVYV